MATKKEILESVKETGEGCFLPSENETYFRSFDASDVREWLESVGYEVVRNFDAGGNGWAVTQCGLWVSTNGYVCCNG